MTGQILGGSPVTEAARYQVLIIWLIATINFSSVFMNTYMVYKIAFESSKHMLRIDRFIEVVRTEKRKGLLTERVVDTLKSAFNLLTCQRRNIESIMKREAYSDIEKQPLFSLESYDTNNKKDYLEILKKEQATIKNSVPLLQLSKLQFSVPKGHTKRTDKHYLNPVLSSSSLLSMSALNQQRVLCKELDFSLFEGETGIVRGASGSGKSTLLRIIAGLNAFDKGTITSDVISLSNCEMTRWRSLVRYVTQYKVDIPGSEF